MDDRRKQVRFNALLAMFRSRNDNKEPQDIYEKYLLKLIVDLGAVYDDNSAKTRVLLPAVSIASQVKVKRLMKREDKLNKLGHLLRTILNIDMR